MKQKFMLLVGISILSACALLLSACNSADAGPAVIDLADPALFNRDAYPDYKLVLDIKSTGTDAAGIQSTFNLFYDIQNQANPKAQHVTMSGEGAEGTVELVILGDQAMTVIPNRGCSIFPTSAMKGKSPEETIPRMDALVTGQVKRIKTGVKVEGILTDRYELTSANMTDQGSAATPVVTKGSVYVAREGGYVVRVEMEGTVSNGPNTESASQMTLEYLFVPVQAGSLEITPPAECENQLVGAGIYPMLEGATELVSLPDALYYNIEAPIDEVLAFYRARMIEKGWAITKDNAGDSATSAALEFTKDDLTVEVSVADEGEFVTVTIQRK